MAAPRALQPSSSTPPPPPASRPRLVDASLHCSRTPHAIPLLLLQRRHLRPPPRPRQPPLFPPPRPLLKAPAASSHRICYSTTPHPLAAPSYAPDLTSRAFCTSISRFFPVLGRNSEVQRLASFFWVSFGVFWVFGGSEGWYFGVL